MVMFNSTGDIIVTNSSFKNNTRLKGGGGGVHVTVGVENKTSIEFSNCNFIENSKYGSRHFAGLEAGGGLQIRLNYIAKHVNVNVVRCHIIGNKADFGGGLFIGIIMQASHNKVSVKDCYIGKNMANAFRKKVTGFGGGLDAGFEYFHNNYNPINNNNQNSITFSNVTIDSNHAIIGGGSTIFLERQNNSNYIVFKDCAWSNNKANYSSAISVSRMEFNSVEKSFIVPVFENCKFFDNQLIKGYTNYEKLRVKLVKVASLAAFTISSSTIVKFKGFTNFTNNSGTALDICYAEAFFCSNSETHFIKNTATKGAAVSISGTSRFKIEKNSKIFFVNNSATVSGGAIALEGQEASFVVNGKNTTIVFHNNSAEIGGGAIHYQLYEKEFLSYQRCFLYSRYHNATFVFKDNKVLSKFGASIYASTLYPCRKYCRYKCNQSDIYKMLNCCIGHVDMDTESNQHSIVTSSDGYYSAGKLNEVYAIPGELIKLDIAVHDELKINVTNITQYVVKVENPRKDSNFKIDSKFQYITVAGKVRIYGRPNTTGVITIRTVDLKNLAIEYTVHLIDCPPGYFDNNDIEERRCICKESEYNYLYCEKNGITSSITIGKWVGYVGQHTLVTSLCPLGFCKQHKSANTKSLWLHEIPSNTTELSNFICQSGRRGTLCGECYHGYSVAFHSALYECRKDSVNCHYGIALYILAELVPVTFLFLLVLLCNINLTSGAINGFVLFAQVIDIMYIDGINLDTHDFLLDIHAFTYGFLNLNFETTSTYLSFCLWKGATTLNILAMKYVTIVYSVILVLCLVKFLNHCTCHRICTFCRKQSFGNSIIYGLSAFLVMCYSQGTRVTLTILHPTILWMQGPKQHNRVVFVDGKMEFLGKEHNCYAIPAMFFFLTLVATPPLILLFNSIVTAVLHCYCKRGWKVSTYWANRLLMIKFKPLLDAFQGCYRDKYRCFASFYFLYKVLFLSLYLFLPTRILFYTVTLLLLIAILTLHSIIRPYKEKWHNIIDSLLLMNTAIVNGLSLYMYSNENESKMKGEIQNAQWIQLALIYLPMCCVVLYIIYRFMKKLCASRQLETHTDNDSSYPDRLLSNSSVLQNYMSCSNNR